MPSCPDAAISIDCGGTLPTIADVADGCTPGYSLTNTTFNTTVTCGTTTTVTFTGTDDCDAPLSLDCEVTITAGSVTPSCPDAAISIDCGGTLPTIADVADGCTPGYSLTNTTFNTTVTCGTTTTVTFTGTDDCDAPLSLECEVTITAGSVMPSCPDAAISIDCGGTLPTIADVADGCTPGYSLTNTTFNTTVTCGTTTTVTFTGTDDCDAPLSLDCEVTITAGSVTPSCPNETIVVECGDDIPSLTAVADGCTPGYEISADLSTISTCGTMATATFSGTDDCGAAVSAVCNIIINPGSVTPTCPTSPIILACGAELPTLSVVGDGCTPGYSLTNTTFNTIVTCGTTTTVTFTGADDCDAPLSLDCEVTITQGSVTPSCPPTPIVVDCGTALPVLSTEDDGCSPGYTITNTTFNTTVACGTSAIVTFSGVDNCGASVSADCAVTVSRGPLPTIDCSPLPTSISCTDARVFPDLNGLADGCTPGYVASAGIITPTLNCDGSGSLSCLLYTSPSPRDQRGSRMPSSA